MGTGDEEVQLHLAFLILQYFFFILRYILNENI